MSKKFEVSVNDVQEFLATKKGLKWDKNIVVDASNVPAKSLEDLAAVNGIPACIQAVRPARREESYLINIGVTPVSFEIYKKDFNYSDIDRVLTFSVSSDISEDWNIFLVQKYGDDYKKNAAEYCQEQKSIIVNKSADKLEEVRLMEKMIWDNHKKEMEHYSKVEKRISAINVNKNKSSLENK